MADENEDQWLYGDSVDEKDSFGGEECTKDETNIATNDPEDGSPAEELPTGVSNKHNLIYFDSLQAVFPKELIKYIKIFVHLLRMH